MKLIFKLTLLFLAVFSIICCNKHRIIQPPYSKLTVIEEKTTYDSISPPVMRVDTMTFDKKLVDVLMFTNKINSKGGEPYYNVFFTVDVEKKIQFRRSDPPTEYEKEIRNAALEIVKQIEILEPAYLNRIPKVKVPYDFKLYFHIKEGMLTIKMFSKGETFFTKQFKWPLQ